jgi:hypothetical protein
VEGAINENPNVPDFIRQFHPPFPVGIANYLGAREYLQLTPTMRPSVPFMVLIDRNGTIQLQHSGEEPYFDDKQDEHIRADVEKLLGGGKKTASHKKVAIKK